MRGEKGEIHPHISLKTFLKQYGGLTVYCTRVYVHTVPYKAYRTLDPDYPILVYILSGVLKWTYSTQQKSRITMSAQASFTMTVTHQNY